MIPRHCIKKHRHLFANKGTSGQIYGFSSSHVRIWDLDDKESWGPNNLKWTFYFFLLEEFLNLLIDAYAEAPILWPPDAKNRLIGKDLDAGKDWRQKKKGMTEDKMAR